MIAPATTKPAFSNCLVSSPIHTIIIEGFPPESHRAQERDVESGDAESLCYTKKLVSCHTYNAMHNCCSHYINKPCKFQCLYKTSNRIKNAENESASEAPRRQRRSRTGRTCLLVLVLAQGRNAPFKKSLVLSSIFILM